MTGEWPGCSVDSTGLGGYSFRFGSGVGILFTRKKRERKLSREPAFVSGEYIECTTPIGSSLRILTIVRL